MHDFNMNELPQFIIVIFIRHFQKTPSFCSYYWFFLDIGVTFPIVLIIMKMHRRIIIATIIYLMDEIRHTLFDDQ